MTRESSSESHSRLGTHGSGGETHPGATSSFVERPEHRSQHGIDILSEDTSRPVERSGKLSGSKVVVTIAVLKGDAIRMVSLSEKR